MNSWWLAFTIGMAVMLFFIALGPHKVTGFLEDRRNMPKWLSVVGALLLLVSLGNLTLALGTAIVAALRQVTVESWVWLVLVLGIFLVGLRIFVDLLVKKPKN